jgi:hypothetical protein
MFKILLSNQEIKQEGEHECIKKQHKTKEDHTPIGFLLDLWPPIMAIVKKYDNNSQALHFLKIA